MTVELDKKELRLITTVLKRHKETYMDVDDEMICLMRKAEGKCVAGDCDDRCEHHRYSGQYLDYLSNLIEKLES